MDADGLTFAVATTAEERVAKRLGLNTVRVGVCVANGVPEGSLVSFGLAGSLGELRIEGTPSAQSGWAGCDPPPDRP